MVCVEDVLAVEGKPQTLLVKITDAEVEAHVRVNIEVVFFRIRVIAFPAFISRMPIYLEFVVLSMYQQIGCVEIECEMRNAADYLLLCVVIIILRTIVMAVIERKDGGKPLVCIVGCSLDADIGQTA